MPLTDASDPDGAFVPAQFSQIEDHMLPLSNSVRYIKQVDKGHEEFSSGSIPQLMNLTLSRIQSRFEAP